MLSDLVQLGFWLVSHGRQARLRRSMAETSGNRPSSCRSDCDRLGRLLSALLSDRQDPTLPGRHSVKITEPWRSYQHQRRSIA